MELKEFMIKEGVKRKYILDTSIVFKWYHQENEDNVDKAIYFYEQLNENKIIIISPGLMCYELLNGFRSKLEIHEDVIDEIIKEIYDILFIVNLDRILFKKAFTISRAINQSFYDSVFIALSEELNAPLVTADKRLYKNARDNDYNVILLSDFNEHYF